LRPVERWSIPAELRHHCAWAVWRYEQDSANRWSKPPYQPNGDKAEASDDTTWSEFDDAYEAYKQNKSPDGKRPYDGVSFAIDPRWGIVGVDLDHVSEHRAEVHRIVHEIDSYTEISPSGDGRRIFVKGSLPPGRRRRDWVEAYVRRRFLTVTGEHVPGTPKTIESRTKQLERVFWQWLGQDEASIKRSTR